MAKYLYKYFQFQYKKDYVRIHIPSYIFPSARQSSFTCTFTVPSRSTYLQNFNRAPQLKERERERGRRKTFTSNVQPSISMGQPIIKPRLPIIRISCRSIDERSQRLRLHQEARLAKSHAQETTPTTSGASSRTGPWKTVVFLRNEARRSVFWVTTIDRCARSITPACILRERRQGSRTWLNAFQCLPWRCYQEVPVSIDESVSKLK